MKNNIEIDQDGDSHFYNVQVEALWMDIPPEDAEYLRCMKRILEEVDTEPVQPMDRFDQDTDSFQNPTKSQLPLWADETNGDQEDNKATPQTTDSPKHLSVPSFDQLPSQGKVKPEQEERIESEEEGSKQAQKILTQQDKIIPNPITSASTENQGSTRSTSLSASDGLQEKAVFFDNNMNNNHQGESPQDEMRVETDSVSATEGIIPLNFSEKLIEYRIYY